LKILSSNRNGKMTRLPDRLGYKLNWRQGKGILPRHGGAAFVSCKMEERPPSPGTFECLCRLARLEPIGFPLFAPSVPDPANQSFFGLVSIRVNSWLKSFPQTPMNRAKSSLIQPNPSGAIKSFL
jgi:hypothetical protein